jgi:hypothetical protein
VAEDLFQNVSIPLRWPDDESGPLLLEVRFHRGERWQCVGLSIDFLDPAKARSLRTSDLRELSLPAVVARAYGKLVQHLEAEFAKALTAEPGPGDELLDYRTRLLEAKRAEAALEAARPRKAGRPPMARAQLERIAEIYSEAFYSGEPPTQAVAAYLGCDKATAARRIALCRKRGVLLSTERGVAGGIPIAMRRVSSRDLELLNIKRTRDAQVRASREPHHDEQVQRGDRDGEGGS